MKADSIPKSSEKWTADQLVFIEWLSTPKMARSPKTQTAFAKQANVHPDTLSNWKRTPGFMDAVNALARLQLKDSLTDVYAALVKAATVREDVQAIKLIMEMSGEYTPKQKLDLDFSKMSDDELERLATGGA
jgi:hypothetical protein